MAQVCTAFTNYATPKGLASLGDLAKRKYCITADFADLKMISNAMKPLFSNKNKPLRCR